MLRSLVIPSRLHLNRLSSTEPDGISYLLYKLTIILKERVNVKYRCKMNDRILIFLSLS